MTGIDRAAAEALIAARLSPRRRDHAHRVAAEAVVLAGRFGASPEAAEVAGLLHDYCRELPDEEMLAAAARHGIPVGPWRLGGRRRSCTGRSPPRSCSTWAWTRRSPRPSGCTPSATPGMTVLEKCVYLADYLEPGPRLPGHRRGARAGRDVAGRGRGRGGAPQPAGHHRPRPRGGPRGARVVQRDSCRPLKGIPQRPPASPAPLQGRALAGLAALPSRRRSSRSRPSSAPGTWRAASPRRSRSSRRAAISRRSSSPRPARRRRSPRCWSCRTPPAATPVSTSCRPTCSSRGPTASTSSPPTPWPPATWPATSAAW